MTFEELNEQVREEVAGPDWMLWKGARYERGACLASDKVVLVHRDHADPGMFEWMEELDAQKKHERWSAEQAEYDWESLISNYAVNSITPVRLFDIRSENEGVFPFLILFRNETRDHNIIVDARRYRMLIDAVPVDSLYGTGPSEALISIQEEIDEDSGQTILRSTGALAPVADRGGRYMKLFRKQAPELGI